MKKHTQRRFWILILSLAALWAAPALAQEESPRLTLEAPMQARAQSFERYFHTYNSDYQYYFMRRQQRLNQALASVSVNHQASGADDTEIKAFLPIYHGERFSFELPFYFHRFPLTQAQQEGLPFNAVHNFFWQAIFNLELSDSLRLALITESHHKGTESSQASLIGSDVAEFVLLRWQLSPQWTVAPAARAKVYWDSQGKEQLQVLPAGHVIWRPTQDLALMTGLPSLFALEWNGPHRFDLATHVMLGEGEGNINVMAAARQGITDRTAVTLRYLRDGFADVYVPEFSYQEAGQGQVVDEIAQYKHRVQLELELHPTDHTMLQFKGGYGIDDGVTLSRDGKEVTTLDGEDGFYGGLTFATFYDLDQ